jgi:glycosyltransferase involved in cell wall biosynthesis
VTTRPALAVVIPVWGDYVARLPCAVASARSQDVALEIVVVDNASTTPIPAVPGAITIRLPRRTTAGAARNVGLAAVTAPLVCFLDADDELLPGTLRRRCARLAARPGCVATVATAVAWVEMTGDTVDWAWPRAPAYRLSRHRRLFALTTAFRNAYPTTGAVIRTHVLRDAGGFADADHEEDWLPAVALAARGHVDLDASPGRRVRIGERSLYGSADLATMLAHRRALRRALRRDPRTRTLAFIAGAALAAVHIMTACVKARPRRRGYAGLISAAAAAEDARGRARQNADIAPQ